MVVAVIAARGEDPQAAGHLEGSPGNGCQKTGCSRQRLVPQYVDSSSTIAPVPLMTARCGPSTRPPGISATATRGITSVASVTNVG